MSGKLTSDIGQAFAPGFLREAVKRWPEDKNSDTMTLVPTRAAQVLGTLCWISGSALLGAGLCDAVFDRTWMMLLALPGAVLLALYMVLTIPHTRAAHALQSIVSAKDGASRKDVALFYVEEKAVAKELEWCENAFKEIAEKSGSWRDPEDRAYESRRQVMRGIEVFSLGLAKADEDTYFPDLSKISDKHRFEQWKAAVNGQKQLVDALVTIWKTLVGPFKIDSYNWEYSHHDELDALGRRLGVDAMVESYLAGVPLEMILAGYSELEN